MFPNPPLGAGPRGPPPRAPKSARFPLPAVDAPAGDTGNSDDGGTADHLLFVAMFGSNANAANARPHAGTPDCNTVPGDSGAGRTVRSPSIDSGAISAADRSLALRTIVDHADRSPRELTLPKVMSRREASTSLRDAFLLLPDPRAALSVRLIAPAPDRHFPAGRHRPPPASRSLGRRIGPILGRR